MGESRLRIGVTGSSIWVDYFRRAFENDPDIDVLFVDTIRQPLWQIMSQTRHVDVLYLLYGWLDSGQFAAFMSCNMRHIPIVVHWIGTDVWRLINPDAMEAKMRRRIKRWLLLRSMGANEDCTHLGGAPWLVEELKSCGIQAKFCPVAYGQLDANDSPIHPLPEKTAVFTYIPKGKEDFYGEPLVLSAARRNPDISFTIVANDESRQPSDLPNVRYYGWVSADEMEEIVRNSTCCIRLTRHDGLGGTIMEAIMRGRYGIFSYSHPYVHRASTSEEVDLALADIRSKNEPNYVGSEFVRSQYSLAVTRERLKGILLSACRDKG